MELVKVKIKPTEGAIIDSELRIELDGENCSISLKAHGINESNFEALDLFGALLALRNHLDQTGASLLCNGARIDVYPSGMSLGMGSGRKAYITRLGKPSLRTDLVDIFDYAEPSKVGTVQEQKDYHEKWVSSLKS